MTPDLDADDWEDLLTGDEPPTPGVVVDRLVGRLGINAAVAEDVIDNATADGPIRLDEDAGMFGELVLDAEETTADLDTDDTDNVAGEDTANQQSEDDASDPLVSDETAAPQDTTDEVNQQRTPDHGDSLVKAADDEDNDVATETDVLDRATPSGRHHYPSEIKAREWWIDWVLAHPYDDGAVDWDATPTKQPVAPFDNGGARPVSWHDDLPDDEHPSTEYETAVRWEGWRIPYEVHAPERVISDEIGLGIILPVGQGPDRPEDNDRTVLLIDWDDCRDPETGEIHPVVGRALAELDGYAEISQSGEGIHQFVFGEIPGGFSKFIRYIDDEPFVGDDRPAIEIYQSGRVCAMTGRHIEGSGEDVVDGQRTVDRLCWEFGTAGNAGPGTPTDPFAAERDDEVEDAGDELGNDEIPDHETVGKALQEAAEYDGDDPDDWEIPDEYNLEYVAVLKARERSANGDDTIPVANWELNGYAATWGYQLGLDKADVIADLRAVAPDDSGIDKEVRQPWRKIANGTATPPSRSTLARRGLLPDRYGETGDNGSAQMVVLPDHEDDELGEDTDGVGGDHETAVDALDDAPEYGALSKAYARERTKATIKDAYAGDGDVLVDALMSMGKSYGAVSAAVETNTPITVLTGRGRKEQYAVLRDWADQHGLDVGTKGHPDGDVYVLPSFKEDCPTANGTCGDDWADLVGRWYDAGASPAQIHAFGSVVVEDNDEIDADDLPCQHEGRCPYSEKWDFDPDDFEILIGHYTHAYRPKVVAGGERQRTAVLDEFPEAYETTIRGDSLRAAINSYLDEHGRAPTTEIGDNGRGAPRAIPYQTFGGLLLDRGDENRRETALAYLEHHGVTPDERAAIQYAEDDRPPEHALAPVAIYTILSTAVGGQLGNRYERTELPQAGGIGVFDHGDDDPNGRFGVSLLRPPETFQFADNVVCLDGTPTVDMWELATGRDLDHEVVLGDRRAEYVETALAFRIVPTTEYVKPYNRAQHVNVSEDAALLDGITAHHGRAPDVITTATARSVWDDNGVIDLDDDLNAVSGPVGDIQIYGNILGSNRFAESDLGVVVGSNHYGDGFIKRWGAYANKAIQRQHVDGDDDGDRPKGKTLSYGPFGDKIHRHMREHDTLQSVFRFGRNSEGTTTIYVATDTLPDWLPTHGRAEVSTASEGMRGVLRALDDLDVATVSAINEHDAVEVGYKQVKRHLSTLRDLDVVDWGDDPEDARRTLYSVADDAEISEHGFADLPDHETVGKGSATAYVREPGDGDELGEDNTDAVEADGGSMQKITPPPTGKTVDVWGMPIPVDLPGDLRYEVMGADGPTRCVDEWGRVWYTYESDGELKTKQRAIPAVSNRRRRRPRRRRGTCRVGFKSQRRAGVSRFAVKKTSGIDESITTDCFGDSLADD